MRQLERRQAETMGWPILEPIEAQGVSRPVALSKEVCVAGAREHVNLKLPSKLVSRSHALFVADRDSIYLRDLASRNHTYLNDQPIREAVLRNGDVIGLGPMTFRCQSGFDRPFEHEELHAPEAELQLESDDHRFPLSGRTALIGSRGDCDVLLRGDDVDPAHAVIYQREGRRFIRDLRSHSDTLVNDEPVNDVELQPGDRIRIGDAHLVYQMAARIEDAAIPLDLEEPLAPVADEVEEELAPEAHERTDQSIGDEFDLGSEEFGLPKSIDAAAPAAEALEAPAAADEPISHDSIPLEDEAQPEEEVTFGLAPEEPERQPAEPLVAPIPAAELEEPNDANDHAPASISAEMHPIAPEPATHPAAEEKMSELLGELVETVAKVQSTWEEIKSESDAHVAQGHSEASEHASA